MADLPTSTAPNHSSSSSSIFSRRPSLFGGKHKTQKHTKNAPSRSSVLRSPTPVLHLNLPPASISPASPASPASPTAAATPDSPPPFNTQYEPALRAPDTPPKRRPSRHSIASTVGDIGLQLRRSRSASLRTNTSSGSGASHPHSHKRTPSATNMAVSFSPEKTPAPAPISVSRPTLSISTFSRSKAKSSDNVKPDAPSTTYDKAPLSALDKPKTPFGMAVPIMPMRAQPTPKDVQHMQQLQRQQSNLGLAPAASILPNGANPNVIFQHIHEMASKRISTLDYLRKAHEGRIYWFNTLLFSKNDLSRLPSFTSRNQARRATQYLLLGFSLPAIIDLNANSPTDYLKALNALLLEFEQYQSIHPADGSAPSSLSRARIPQMFKRANLGGKGRRSSSATGDFPLLTPQTSFSGELPSTDSPPTDDLLPNESYIHLQTPSLPFDPDFFSTFATLCDVLIDCYTKMLSMLSTPESIMMASGGVPSTVGDLFNKADTRVRKILLAGVVREFEDSCRAGLRSEVGGVGKVVLGGLM